MQHSSPVEFYKVRGRSFYCIPFGQEGHIAGLVNKTRAGVKPGVLGTETMHCSIVGQKLLQGMVKAKDHHI